MSKTLFIDYDGTLHNTDARFASRLDGLLGLSADKILDAYIHVHRSIVHKRYPDKHDDYFFHQSFLFSYLGREYDENEARNTANTFKEAQEQCWTEPIFYPEALTFLDKVKGNFTLCLTTGDFAPEKAAALEKAAGKQYFGYVFDHNHQGIKGSDSYFKNALISTECRPECAVAIGDSIEQDIIRAKEAGIAAVWVNRKGLSPEQPYQE